jgi:hypothetical protein
MVHSEPSSKGVLLDFLTIEYQKLIKYTVHLFFYTDQHFVGYLLLYNCSLTPL